MSGRLRAEGLGEDRRARGLGIGWGEEAKWKRTRGRRGEVTEAKETSSSLLLLLLPPPPSSSSLLLLLERGEDRNRWEGERGE